MSMINPHLNFKCHQGGNMLTIGRKENEGVGIFNDELGDIWLNVLSTAPTHICLWVKYLDTNESSFERIEKEGRLILYPSSPIHTEQYVLWQPFTYKLENGEVEDQVRFSFVCHNDTRIWREELICEREQKKFEHIGLETKGKNTQILNHLLDGLMEVYQDRNPNHHDYSNAESLTAFKNMMRYLNKMKLIQFVAPIEDFLISAFLLR